MKLIDAPIGIFRFDGELVLKTEYCSENKLSGKYIPDCYIVRTGEYFFGGAKTANELNNLDVEPVDFAELLPTVTDTISRQVAINALGELITGSTESGYAWFYTDDVYKAIKQLPPAQPAPSQVAKDIARIVENEQDMRVIGQERIRGRWIPVGGALYKCDQCGVVSLKRKFCSECGAEMREVTE